MKATRLSLTFIALALCGHGHAGPCKPKPSTTISSAFDETSSIEATLSVSTEFATSAEVETVTDTTSGAEPSTIDLSSFISESGSSTATATSDAQLSSSTELATLSIITETATVTTTLSEISSSTEVLTTSNTVEATTSEVPTTTTTIEESESSQLFINPSFDEPNADGDHDGSPWVLTDSVSPRSVRIASGPARSGRYSAYWTVTSTTQNGRVFQPVDLGQSQFYQLSYWWYVDEDQQPQGLTGCYITVEQRGVDGLTSSFPDFLLLPSTLPLKTWTRRDVVFNSINITPANMEIGIICSNSAGSGFKIAIDDIEMSEAS